ncbi:MAG: fibronectin type III domain-containing protein, partial [Acidimicrobiaceae bacterium]|nr:fibronectin type III domain-containing protein [Acidimicrobiaceae bacterium]
NTDTVSTEIAAQTSVVSETPVAYTGGSAVPTGTAGVGSVLTAPADTWSGSAVVVSYQWYDCTGQVASSSAALPVSPTCSTNGGNASTYTLLGTDAGKYVAVMETGTNAVSSATQFSPSTLTAVVASPPVAGGSPVLGTETVAGTVVNIATPATWTAGNPGLGQTTYSYQWYRCSSLQNSAPSSVPAGCSAISGAIADTYTLTPTDMNNYVLVAVTASNGVLPNPVQYSASSAVITGTAPTNVSAPTVSVSSPQLGVAETSTNGTWTGSPTTTSDVYQWYACTTAVVGGPLTGSTLSNGGCVAIAGAVASSYSPTTSVSGKYLLIEVTQINGITPNGVAVSSTTGSTVPAGTATGGTGTYPTITAAGGTLTAAPGTFTGAPAASSDAYQWYRCSASVTMTGTGTSGALPPVASSCVAIAGATATTYNLVTADVNQYILVGDTENNGVGGPWTEFSNSTPQIVAVGPSEVGPPSLSGSAQAGTVLTTSNGTWGGVPAPTYTYQYYSCNGTFGGGSTITGPVCNTIGTVTSSNTFTPSVSQNGLYILVGVTASNGGGSATYYSATSNQVTDAAPLNTSPPTVPATSSTSVVMGSTPGTWTGNPAPTFTYQWFYCSSRVVNSSVSLTAGCAAIPAATGPTYQPSGTYANDYFLVSVTGSNGVMSGPNIIYVTVYSASTQTALVSTLSITGLTISGTASVGNTLSSTATIVSAGTYTPTYQWYACTAPVIASTSVPAYCAAIVGASGPSFAPTATQAGYYLTLAETVTNISGSAVAVAQSTALVTTSIPGAPTAVFAVAGVGSATVYWAAPATGLAATSYTVTSSPAGGSCTSTTTTCVVTGLLHTTAYTFTVTATNSYGTGPASLASLAITPTASIPAAPTAVTAVGSNTSATVTWTAANANGSPITAYTVTSFPAGGSCSVVATTCVVNGLTNGTAYTFSVTATNALGVGPASLASNSVTPKALIPAAPTGVSTLSMNGKVTVHWTASVTNGSTITGYLVTVSLGTVSKSCVTTGLTCSVISLPNGKTYNVSVVAQSAAGNSPAATATAQLRGTPSVVSLGGFSRLLGGFVLNIRPPANNGGLVVKYYQYSINGGHTWKASRSRNSLKLIAVGLLHHHRYMVMVRAVNAAGGGTHSPLKAVYTN